MKNKNKTERAAVFVDGGNFYHNMRKKGVHTSGLDYSLLSKKLCIERELVETRFYVGAIKQTAHEKSRELYRGQRKFISALEQQDKVQIFLGRIEYRQDGGWVEKAVDVMIATDMVSMAYEDTYDVAYLLSADGDFTPAIKKVRQNGKKVFAASPVFGYQIKQAADTFIQLEKDFFHGCYSHV